MVKNKKCRIVSALPGVTYFKPAGIPFRFLSEVRLSVEEAEALRLKELEGLEQLEGAMKMGISRPTFQRVLSAARKKVADAILNGKAIRIEGGSFQITSPDFGCSRLNATEPKFVLNEGVNMKYAIPTHGGALSPHFGQSTEFMIIDTDGSRIVGKETISTTAHNCGGLPGILAGRGVKVVLAGGMGYGPRFAFQQSGIEVVLGVSETDPEKAVLAHLNRTLVSGQNVCDHGDVPCDHGGEQHHNGHGHHG
jgi:predicted DNA-binding protein (UPF0251 family)/predicted Fe-Mo cluster-binding NifX family protein